VEIDICPASLDLRAVPERDMTQMGRIVEQRIIEAIVLSAPGPVECFRPSMDTGGYDWAGCPYARYDALRLAQFKGTFHLMGRPGSRFQRVHIIFDAPALHPHRNTLLVLARYDLTARALADPLWVVPSRRLGEVARQHYCRYHDVRHWHFVASPAPKSRDVAARYALTQADLATAIFPRPLPRPTLLPPTLSPIRVERGDFFEAGFLTRFLRDCSGTEKLLQPDPDLGRDALAVRMAPFAWASLAVKGTAVRARGGDVITVRVRRQTFHPHRRHFVLVQYFDEAHRELHPVSWFIPSLAFARLANRNDEHYRMSTTLRPTRNRWTRFTIPTEDDARTLMRALRRS
jgi:hypothetical protein